MERIQVFLGFLQIWFHLLTLAPGMNQTKRRVRQNSQLQNGRKFKVKNKVYKISQAILIMNFLWAIKVYLALSKQDK